MDYIHALFVVKLNKLIIAEQVKRNSNEKNFKVTETTIKNCNIRAEILKDICNKLLQLSEKGESEKLMKELIEIFELKPQKYDTTTLLQSIQSKENHLDFLISDKTLAEYFNSTATPATPNKKTQFLLHYFTQEIFNGKPYTIDEEKETLQQVGQDLQTKLGIANQEKQDLQAKLEIANQGKQDLQTKLGIANQEKQDLQQANQALQENLRAESKEKETLQQIKQDLQTKLEITNQEKQDLQQAKQDLQTKLGITNQEKESLQQQITNLNQDKHKLQEEIVTLKSKNQLIAKKNKYKYMTTIISCCTGFLCYFLWCVNQHSATPTYEPTIMNIESKYAQTLPDSNAALDAANTLQQKLPEIKTTAISNDNYLANEQTAWSSVLRVDTKYGEDAAGYFGYIRDGDHVRSKSTWKYDTQHEGCINIASEKMNITFVLSNSTSQIYDLKAVHLKILSNEDTQKQAVAKAYGKRGNNQLPPPPIPKTAIIIPEGDNQYIWLQNTPLPYQLSGKLAANQQYEFYAKLKLNGEDYKNKIVKFQIKVILEINGKKQEIISNKTYLLGHKSLWSW
jgi:hypothetical protein